MAAAIFLSFFIASTLWIIRKLTPQLYAFAKYSEISEIQ